MKKRAITHLPIRSLSQFSLVFWRRNDEDEEEGWFVHLSWTVFIINKNIEERKSEVTAHSIEYKMTSLSWCVCVCVCVANRIDFDIDWEFVANAGQQLEIVSFLIFFCWTFGFNC